MCLCVWKVITFCEEDMRGNHVPVGKGVLNDRFLGFGKFLKSFEIFRKKVLKVYISMRIAHSKNPVLNQSGPSLMNFWRTFLKL